MRLGILPLYKTIDYGQNIKGVEFEDYVDFYNLAYIITFLEKRIQLNDYLLVNSLKDLLAYQPDIVLISSRTTHYKRIHSVSQQIKYILDVPVILCGEHISYLPQSLPDTVDIGIVGEGELTIAEVLSIYHKDPDANIMKFSRVPGIVYQSRGKVYGTTPRKLIGNIDKLPQPRRRLFNKIPAYLPPILITARGNRWTRICGNKPKQAPPKYRFHSPERLIKDLLPIVEEYEYKYENAPYASRVSMVLFTDDLLLTNVKRLEAFVKLIKEEKIDQKLFFAGVAQAEVITPDVARLLKEMNFKKLNLHLANVSNRLTNHKDNKKINQQALELLNHYKIEVGGVFKMGSTPRERDVDIAQNYWFVKQNINKFTRLTVAYLPPYPGTHLWEYYEKTNKITSKDYPLIEWSKFNFEYQTGAPIISKYISQEDFGNIYNKFESLQDEIQGEEQIALFDLETKKEALKAIYDLLKFHFPPDTKDILEIGGIEEIDMKEVLEDFKGFNIDKVDVKLGYLSQQLTKKYDVIMMYFSIVLLRHPEKTLKYLLQFLNPGGRICIVIRNAQNIDMIGKYFEWPITLSTNPPFLRFFTEPTLRKLLKSLDLKVVKNIYNLLGSENPDYQYFIGGFIPLMTKIGNIPVPESHLLISDIILYAEKRKEENVRPISPTNA